MSKEISRHRIGSIWESGNFEIINLKEFPKNCFLFHSFIQNCQKLRTPSPSTPYASRPKCKLRIEITLKGAEEQTETDLIQRVEILHLRNQKRKSLAH